MSRERNGASDLSNLEKGLAVLRHLAGNERSLTAGQLANATGLNRTTIYRLCEVLERDGWAMRSSDGETTRFELGVAAHGFAVLVTNKFDTEARVRPVITELSQALGETVHVGTLERAEVVHIARAIPSSGLALAAPLGSHELAHCAALGKALLATLTPDEVDKLYPDQRLPVRTAHSIATRRALHAELERIRSDGYAIDNQEGQLGIKCVGVPVFTSGGRALFALSVTSLPARLDGERLPHTVQAVRGAAALMSASFGGAVPNAWASAATASV